MTAPKHALQRIRVDAKGYDDTGAYWGAGPDVFIATSGDGSDEITVRANNVKEAREKIAAELARAPTAPPVNTAAIGGNAPRKTRYEIAWTNPLTHETVTICITHSRDYLSSGSDHLEVESIRPKKAPLPITETGYRSHFIPPLELMNEGGAVIFVTAWIEQEAKGKAWSKAAAARQQGDLFSWAEAQSEVGKREAVKKPGKRKAPQVAAGQPVRDIDHTGSEGPRRRDGMPARRPKRSTDPS